MNQGLKLRLALMAGVAAVTIGGVAAAMPAQAQSAERDYAIPAQELDDALRAFAIESDVDVAFDPAVVRGKTTRGVRGRHSAEAALRILLAGSGLSVRRTASGGFAVSPSSGEPRAARGVAVPQERAAIPAPAPTAVATGEVDERAEIVVTGTSLRGKGPVGSPVLRIGADEVRESGYATVDRLLDNLPQNYGGGFGQDINMSSTGNVSGGTAVNLRGLGADATLVLLDGRRLPLTGLRGDFVDVSAIPAIAIKRIEVLPDGASAIYGSEAIAGVVNFILRDDLDGFEADASVGIARGGDATERRAAAIAGKVWHATRVSGGVEYYKRDALASADRRFTADSDLRPYGGTNFSSTRSNPGTITAVGVGAFRVPTGQDGRNLRQSDLVAGTNLQNTREGTDITPAQERVSGYLKFAQEIGANVTVNLDVFGAHRESVGHPLQLTSSLTVPAANAFRAVNGLFPGRTLRVDYSFVDDFGAREDVSTTDDFSAVLDARIRLPFGWEASANAAYASESSKLRAGAINTQALGLALADTNPATAFNPFGDGSYTSPATLAAILGYSEISLDSRTRSVGVLARGDLFSLSGGPIRAAIGYEHRDEEFRDRQVSAVAATPLTQQLSDGERAIDAAFVELAIPVLGPSDTPFLRDLTLSLAGRVERYSDFGTTANPKIGLEWSPFDWLTLRGSGGTSFKAPKLSDLDDANVLGAARSIAILLADPRSPTGQSVVLGLTGGNPDLEEQTARSLTFGADIRPADGAVLSVGYFNVRFKDRIANIALNNLALPNEGLYPQLVTRDPDPAAVAALMASPGFTNAAGITSPSQVAVILDGRSNNLARTTIEGIDFNGRYAFDTAIGKLTLGLNLSHLLRYEQAVTEGSPSVDLVDTFGNPADLRGRASFSWRSGAFSASGAVNYVDGYEDRVSAPAREVGSWTTIDLRVAYDFEGGAFRDATLELSAANLLDADPPFVNNPAGIAYDPANADPFGRIVALRFTGRF